MCEAGRKQYGGVLHIEIDFVTTFFVAIGWWIAVLWIGHQIGQCSHGQYCQQENPKSLYSSFMIKSWCAHVVRWMKWYLNWHTWVNLRILWTKSNCHSSLDSAIHFFGDFLRYYTESSNYLQCAMLLRCWCQVRECYRYLVFLLQCLCTQKSTSCIMIFWNFWKKKMHCFLRLKLFHQEKTSWRQ